MFLALDPIREGRDARLIHILERSESDLETAFQDQPLVEAALHQALGAAYSSLGLYARAEDHMKKSLDLRLSAPGEPEEIAHSYQSLGALLTRRSRFQEAEKLLHRALALRREIHGPEHPLVATTLASLAAVLRERGKIDEALTLSISAAEMQKKLGGDGSPEVIHSLTNLASSLVFRGRYDRAEELLKEARNVSDRVWGRHHLSTAGVMVLQAKVLMERGDFRGAEALLREALSMRREKLSGDHPDLAAVLIPLADNLLQQGKARDSWPLIQEALGILEKAHAGPNLAHAGALEKRAAIQLNLGNPDEAEKDFKRALAIYEKIFQGKPHRYIAGCYDSLAICDEWRRNLEGAERNHKRALEICRRSTGDPDPDLSNCLFNLGVFRRKKGELEEAERLLRKSLEMELQMRARDSHIVAEVEYQLALISSTRRERLGEAERLFRHAAAVFEKCYGRHDLRPTYPLFSLARALDEFNRLEEAEPLLRRIIEMRSSVDPPNPVELTRARMALGACLLKGGRLMEAEKYLTQAYRNFLERTGAGSEYTRQSLRLLASLYRDRGDEEEAGKYLGLIGN
jgi:tetratricopeptide (TPR) repeat protein